MDEPFPEMPKTPEAELTPVEKLEAAAREYVNSVSDDDTPVLMDQAIMVWEQVRLDNEGDAQRQVNYTTLTYNASLSATAGLLDIGREVLSGDLFD